MGSKGRGNGRSYDHGIVHERDRKLPKIIDGAELCGELFAFSKGNEKKRRKTIPDNLFGEEAQRKVRYIFIGISRTKIRLPTHTHVRSQFRAGNTTNGTGKSGNGCQRFRYLVQKRQQCCSADQRAATYIVYFEKFQ